MTSDASRAVRHPKYGIGTVVKEDDSMITVAFDGYGEKEFIKAFSELTNEPDNGSIFMS